jgi:hypothetical protein
MEQLPSELLAAVMGRLPRTDFPAARLVSTACEAAVAPFITSITIRRWPVEAGADAASAKNSAAIRMSSSSSLAGVKRLEAAVDSTAGGQQLLQLMGQLPQLQQLCCRGLRPLRHLLTAPASHSMAALQVLEMPESSSSSLPRDLRLPALRELSIYRLDGPVQELAAVAPGLQRLRCCFMRLLPPAEGDASSSSSTERGLANCTSLSVQLLEAGSAAHAVAGLAAAFPQLVVLETVPQLELMEPAGAAGAADQLSATLCLEPLLVALPRLTSVSDPCGELRFEWGGSSSSSSLSKALSALAQLQHLDTVLHAEDMSGCWPDGASVGSYSNGRPQLQRLACSVRHTTQLRSLRLAAAATAVRGGEAVQLIKALAQLPHLKKASLPATLLCNECCPGAHAALAALAASSSLQRLTLDACCAGEAAGCSVQGINHKQCADSAAHGRRLLADAAAART